MNGLTTSEVAERLDVPQTTIRTWVSQLPIPAKQDSRGRHRFDEDAIAVLEAIKKLRTEDAGYNTIRRVIEPATSSNGEATNIEQEGSVEQRATTDGVGSKALVAEVVAEVVAVIRGENEQAEKYARATHRIGELEERVRALEAERERLGGELAEAKDKILLLEAPKARGWWPWRRK